MKSTRPAVEAAFGSWVTITIVCHRCGSLGKQRENLGAGMRVEVSGRLVGQHQLGLGSSARAIATRCCSPPESSVGPVGRAGAEAHAGEQLAARARAAASRRPAISAGSITFSSAVSAASRLKNWNTKPIRSRRTRSAASSSSPS